MSEAAIYEDLIRHERWLMRLARGLVAGDDDASELVQETFVRAIETPPADWTRPRAWLEAVLRNLVASRRRRRSPEVLDALEAPEVFSTSAALPEHALERFEAARAVGEAVEALPEREKQVVLMFWQEELGIGAIASSLELTESAVHKQLASAHEHLRHRLNRDYGDGGWTLALAPLTALRAPEAGAPASTAAPGSAVGASAALVSVLAVAGACAIAIPIWFAATSGGDEESRALAPAGNAASGELPTASRALVSGAGGPAGRVAGPGPEAVGQLTPGSVTPEPAAPAATADGQEPGPQEPDVPFASVRGGLTLGGERVEGWAARLVQIEGCTEDCTVRSTMEGTTFDLSRRSFGHHKLVLDSNVEDGVYSTLRHVLALDRGEQRELEFVQETAPLAVTGVPAHLTELYAYWTDGAGTEFMQRVLVRNGEAQFPSAPVGPVELKVRHERIAAPSAWDVIGRVRPSAAEPSTYTLPH